ncbi:MAG: RlpA-like double-psi beta-barrel domain-containing protein [bacterium]|nr:RlpA-like double-psi beta-barrel domain-containing protein [bacterium]
MKVLLARLHQFLWATTLPLLFVALPAHAEGGTIAISVTGPEERTGQLVRLASLPFEIHIPPHALSEGSAVLITEVAQIPSPPEGFAMVSPLYHVSIAAPSGVHVRPALPLYIRYKLNVFKEVRRTPYVVRGDSWKPLAVHAFTAEKGIYTYRINEADQDVAFFEPIVQEGLASWYRYKNCDCAASTVYPRGTIVRVWRVAEDGLQDAIDVVVNDFGPDAKKHPERVIDLDISVFKKLARKGSGVIRVRTELLTRREEVTAALKP